MTRSHRTLKRLEDLREKNDGFLHETIRELSTQDVLLRERHEALEIANREQHRIQEELIASERKANEANRAKSAFLANMSHELRTPLTAIIGYSEFLIECGLEDRIEALDDLGRVMLSARHLLSLVNDILDVSKIEAGHYDVALDEFDVVSLIEEMLAAASVLVEKNQNQLIWDSPSPIVIYSDAKAVRQCLFNLVSNAAKFTSNGSLEIECQKVGAVIEIAIRDSGIGMSATELEQIFDEFSQVAGSGFGGTGLGLAITRRLIAMINGSIRVESEPGKGTTFTVVLPVRCVEQPEENRRRRSSTMVESAH